MNIELSGFNLLIFAFTISVVSIALQEYIKIIVLWIPKQIWRHIYNWWSGTIILRPISIRKYKKSIEERHSKIEVPFRPNRPLILQEIYVPLRLYRSQITETIDSQDAVKKYNRLAVIGEPGSGKSTMLKHLLFTYINDTQNRPLKHLLFTVKYLLFTLKHFLFIYIDDEKDKPLVSKFPIFLELNRFTSPNVKVFDELLSTLNKNGFPNGEKFLKKHLEKGDLIILMDGLDEISLNERHQLIKDLKDTVISNPKISFVITCRSAVYNNELDGIIDQTLEIVEFDENQISQFLNSWKMPKEKSVNQLLKTLHDRPLIMELARNPLMLTIIAYLYCDTVHELPHSRAEFYKLSCDVLLNLWHHEQNHYSHPRKKEVLKHLALFNQDNSEDSSRRTISYKSVMEEIGKILTSINLEIEDSEPILKEIVERSGLLISIDGGDSYQFAHLTLQEYFAAEEFGGNQKGLINRYINSPDTWRETVKLWCGLNDCTSLIEQLYSNDSTIAFECLADALKIEDKLADRIISEFESRFTIEITPESIQRAFGTVASNIKTQRGQSVFKFLVDVLENDNLDTELRQSAVFALSVTNLPEAAEALVCNISTFAGCKNSLIRMGDLAIAALNKSNLSEIHCIEILLEIKTPSAAKAIVPYLWNSTKLNKTENFSYAAAWSLGSLIKNKNIENALRDFLSRENIESDSLDWIWSPFENSSTLSLSKICGRIGYILNTYDPIADFETFKLDNRISIPLFILNLNENDYRNIKFDANFRKISDLDPEKNLISFNQKMKILEYLNKYNTRLSVFLDSMDEKALTKIIYLILNERKPTINDWININKKDKYSASVHNKFMTLLQVGFIPIGIMSYIYMFFTPFYNISGQSNTSAVSVSYLFINGLYYIFDQVNTGAAFVAFPRVVASILVGVISAIVLNSFLISVRIFAMKFIKEDGMDQFFSMIHKILLMPFWIIDLAFKSLDRQDFKSEYFHFMGFMYIISTCVIGIVSNYCAIGFISEWLSVPFFYVTVIYLIIIILLIIIYNEIKLTFNPLKGIISSDYTDNQNLLSNNVYGYFNKYYSLYFKIKKRFF